MISREDISIVVPAYNRAPELGELLRSILNQTMTPGEIVVVEDCSPERAALREVCHSLASECERAGIRLNYIENEVNLGFDRNLRKCLGAPTRTWALLLGNDDLLLPNAVQETVKFLAAHDVEVASCSFVRFSDDISRPLGVSRVADADTVFKAGEASSGMIFRTGAFMGGLVFNVDFCRRNETTSYDGSLYYQIYLFALAFCSKGIGYIACPIAAGRSGNAPMFGSADNEKTVHVPGAYTAAGRSKMWQGVLKIIGDRQASSGVTLVPQIRHELIARQSFHIFEMNAGAGGRANRDLKSELKRLDLFDHPVPVFFYTLNIVFGKHALHVYRLCRKLMQRK